MAVAGKFGGTALAARALASTAMTAPLAAYFARRDGQPIFNPRLNDNTGVQILV